MQEFRTSHPHRVMVVDDHVVVRQGLISLLERRRGFRVVAQAASVREAIDKARLCALDLGLSRQERRILELLGEGMTNEQIARALLLSDKTVKNYVSLILGKVQLERRAQAAAFVANHSGSWGQVPQHHDGAKESTDMDRA